MIKCKNINNKKQSDILINIVFAILLIFVISLIIPLLWGLLTSFKTRSDFIINPLGLPSEFMFSNYISAFENFFVRIWAPDEIYDVYLIDMFKNSLIYALGCSFLNTLVPCITAYLMAKFKYKFSKVLFVIVLVTLSLPLVGTLPAEINMLKSINLFGTWGGMFVLKANFLGTFTLVFYAAFKNVPDAFSEAAEIDGASEFCVLTKIMLPLVKLTFSAIMLLKFIALWNEYEIAMIYLPYDPTAAYGLWQFENATGRAVSSVPMKITGCMLLFLPILVLFLLFQDKLIGNISLGGIKG